jgi:hypothetical protein
MNAAVAIAQLDMEGGPVLREIARREPAKVVAPKFGFRPRHVYNLREGETGIGWQHFILAAQQTPELRALVAKWLGFESPLMPQAVEMLRQIKQLAASLPEEGDQA